MFLPFVEIARLCRRYRLAARLGIEPANRYWHAIDFTVEEIMKR